MSIDQNSIESARALLIKLSSGRQEYDFLPATLVSHAADDYMPISLIAYEITRGKLFAVES